MAWALGRVLAALATLAASPVCLAAPRAAPATAGAAACPPGAAECLAQDGVDEGSLLQVKSKPAAKQEPTTQEVLQEIIKNELGGRQAINWWNLPAQRSPEQLAECQSKLQDFENVTGTGLEWGVQFGGVGPALANNCTKVPGLFEHVPEALQGVFWMKGNAMNEELATFQMGQWFEEYRLFASPMGPFSWVWAGGTPKDPKAFGLMYSPFVSGYATSALAVGHTTWVLRFLPCPGAAPGYPGSKCEKGTGAAPEFTYAELSAHTLGNISIGGTQFGGATYTMERYPDDAHRGPPGSAWYRGIYWFGGGVSEMGSYDAVKVMDGQGRPVEPWYSEYLEYMGSVPQVFWAGYSSPVTVEEFKKGNIEAAALTMGTLPIR